MIKTKSFANNALGILLVLSAGIVATRKISSSVDIRMWDPSYYLMSGAKLAQAGLPSADWAPLYAIWHYILHLLTPSLVSQYFINQSLMTLVPPVLMFVLLRRLFVPLSVAMIGSWLFLLSNVNGPDVLKVTNFALIIVLITAILATTATSPFAGATMCALGSLLASFVRPEFVLTYILCSAYFLYLLVSRRHEPTAAPRHRVMWWFLVSAALFYCFGYPLGGERGLGAFAQHIAYNHTTWTKGELNPWLDYQAFIKNHFGDVHSVGQAMLANPFLFFRHILYNSWKSPFVFARNLLPIMVAPSHLNTIAATAAIVLCILINRSKAGRLLAQLDALRVFLLASLITSIVAVVMVFPEEHYMVVPCSLFIVIACLALWGSPSTKDIPFLNVALLGLVLLAITPCMGNRAARRSNYETIQCIKSLGIGEKINILAAFGYYSGYVGENFHEVRQSEKNVGFDAFLKERNIGMIVESDGFDEDGRFKRDPEWWGFKTNYVNEGFRKIGVTNSENCILLRINVLTR